MYRWLKMLSVYSYLVLLLSIAIFGAGCSSYILQQSPETLPQGETSLRFGVTGIRDKDSSDYNVYPHVSYRRGLSTKVDMGIEGVILPTGCGTYLDFSSDIKVRLFRYRKFNISMDHQVSLVKYKDKTDLFFAPSILFGWRRAFGGIKFISFYGGFVPAYYVGTDLRIGKVGFVLDIGTIGKRSIKEDGYIFTFSKTLLPEFGVYINF